MKRLSKRIDYKKIAYFAMLLVLLLTAFTTARRAANSVSFYYINGDFQNYNGFNRLLSGQVPFRDFAYYLGFGVLYSNSALLALLGNTFVNSVFVTSFLSSLCFLITLYMLFYIFRKKHFDSMIFTSIIGLFLYGIEFFLTALSDAGLVGLANAVNTLYGSLKFFYEFKSYGNSFRVMRALVLILIVVIALVLAKAKDTKLIKRIRGWNIYAKSALVGGAGGAVILWSNDFGLAGYVALAFCLFLWLCLSKRGIWKVVFGSLCYIGASLASWFLLLTLFTAGSPLSWVKNVFGVSSYQFWYYGADSAAKVFRLWDLPPFNGEAVVWMLAAFALLVYWLIRLIRKNERGVLDYAKIFLMTGFLVAGYFYNIKSAVELDIFFPMFQMIFAGGVCALLSLLQSAVGVIQKTGVKKFFRGAVAVTCCVIIAFGGYFNFSMNRAKNMPDASAYYTPELGGDVASYYDSLIASRVVLGEGVLFSTYASAVDVMRSQFQPSGYDYIIHVLGDDAREDYLASFRESDPAYVAAIRWDATKWETWCIKANWFFYREFYQGYRPFYADEYAVYYNKATQSNELVSPEITITQNRIDAATVEILVEMPAQADAAIVDVRLEYASSFTSARWKSAAINRAVMLESFDDYLGGVNYLPPSTDTTEVYIPIVVVDGVGRVVVSSNPAECTTLEFESAEALGAFDFGAVTYDYESLKI